MSDLDQLAAAAGQKPSKTTLDYRGQSPTPPASDFEEPINPVTLLDVSKWAAVKLGFFAGIGAAVAFLIVFEVAAIFGLRLIH